jgi:post-segregation antitoxin (ccd killing protein)
MGLVRKANVDDVAAGKDGDVDMSSVLRQAVAAEIERQRLERLKGDAKRDTDPAHDED